MDEKIRRAMAPTNEEIAALPLTTNPKTALELMGTGRDNVLDIGCGDGKFTRALTAQFRDVTGIDVKERAIGRAKAAAEQEGKMVDFRIASGEELPWDDAHFEVVVFSNSLHHMPTPAKALAEAARVMKPKGLLYIMEPVPAGNYQEATKLVNDETVVRTEAYQALQGMAKAGFTHKASVMYRARRSFANFEEWKADQLDRDQKRLAMFEANPTLVRTTFENAGEKEDGKLTYTQVFRVDLWQKA
jgi:ubiquinone/menaquinone biosynthesis C-methylase UbiE